MAKKEIKTDLWVARQLDDCKIKYDAQGSNVKELNEALQSASKQGTGKAGYVVNVVEFTNETPLKIVKIPRTLNEIKEILTHRNAETKMERYLIEIANFLAFTFSRPIRSGDTDFEYLPTQYLVNAIRASDQSIQGIAYPSFQSHVGTNYVFFRQDDLTLQNQPEKIIRVQNVTYDCCSLNDLTEVINPSQVDYNPILTEENVDEMKKQIVRAHENYNLPPIS